MNGWRGPLSLMVVWVMWLEALMDAAVHGQNELDLNTLRK